MPGFTAIFHHSKGRTSTPGRRLPHDSRGASGCRASEKHPGRSCPLASELRNVPVRLGLFLPFSSKKMLIGPLKNQDLIITESQISSSGKFWKDRAALDSFVAASRRPLQTGLRVSAAPVLTSPSRLPHPAHSADPSKLARETFCNVTSCGSIWFREFCKPKFPAHAAHDL